MSMGRDLLRARLASLPDIGINDNDDESEELDSFDENGLENGFARPSST